MFVNVFLTCLSACFLCMYNLQLHDEYERDKQQALDRIAAEVEQSIKNMRNSIERAYERQRDELTVRLDVEQKDRLSALKRLQWVCIILLLLIRQEAQLA